MKEFALPCLAFAGAFREQKQGKEKISKESAPTLRKKKRKVEASDKVVQQEFAGKAPKFVGTLTFKALSPGFKLLGVVIEVCDCHILSLSFLSLLYFN